MWAEVLVVGIGIGMGWLGVVEAAKPAGQPAKSPAKAPSVLDEVQKGRAELKSWNTGYIKLRSGECVYLYPLLRTIELRKQPAAPERDAELMALRAMAVEESTAGECHGQVGNPWSDVDTEGLARSRPIIVAAAGAHARVRVIERPTPTRDHFVVGLESSGGVHPEGSQWTTYPSKAAIRKAPAVRGTLDPELPLLLEPVGTVSQPVEAKGVVSSTELPLFEAKPLAQATPTAEELATYIRESGRLLIRNSVRVNTWQPVKQVTTRTGPTFTEKATVPDGARRYKFEWTRETKAVEFKPTGSKPQPANTPTDPNTETPTPPK